MPAHTVSSAIWASDGVLFVRRLAGFSAPLLLNYHIFANDGAFDELEKWCALNNITIEGVRPLPTVYARAVDERRGV